MKDKEIFENFKIQDLFKQIINNSRETRNKLKDIIQNLANNIKDTVDLQILSPEISDYMNILVKNDEILIKLANIVAKSEANNSNNQDTQLLLTPKQKQQLFDNVNQEIKPFLYKHESKIAKIN